MQWSKLRADLLEFITPKLRGRIDYHLTTYRKLSEQAHEVWITIDRERVFSASYFRHARAENVVWWRRKVSLSAGGKEGKTAEDILTSREIHDAGDVVSSFRTYLDLDPQIALTSTDPILRALAMVDRRIGTRTLRSVRVESKEHSLVKRFRDLRVETMKAETRKPA